MTIRFVEEAQDEFLDAISYYEEARIGLGHRLKVEVDRCVARVAAHPDLYRVRANGCRRINLRVFPYYLAFIVRGDALWVLAVAHARRKPSYWIARRNNRE